MNAGPPESPVAIVRTILGIAAVTFGIAGLFLHHPRVLAAAGAFALIWTAWDLLWDRVFEPAVRWALEMFAGADAAGPDLRPTLDDTIRLLESHLDHDAARRVHLQAAIRLEEIYRTIRKDPVRAREVIERVRRRYPDAEELRGYVGEWEDGT